MKKELFKVSPSFEIVKVNFRDLTLTGIMIRQDTSSVIISAKATDILKSHLALTKKKKEEKKKEKKEKEKKEKKEKEKEKDTMGGLVDEEDILLPGKSIRLDLPWNEMTDFPPVWCSPRLTGMHNGTGKRTVWQIGFNRDTQMITYVSGLEHGKKQYFDLYIEKGLVNRTIDQQGYLVARSRYSKKLRERYSDETMDNTYKICHKVMLACTYVNKDILSGENRKKKSTESYIYCFPVVVQPKFDGVRCMASMLGDGSIDMRSRKNKPYLYLDGIKEELKILLSRLSTGAVIDGELYIHGEPFYVIQSAVTTANTKHKDNEKLEYYIYDIILPGEPMTTEKRYAIIKDAWDKDFTKLVNISYEKVFSHKDISKYHDRYVREGFEGAIIRYIYPKNEKEKKTFVPDEKILCNMRSRNKDIEWDKLKELCLYRPIRSQGLLKVKAFIEEEVIIIGGHEGTSTDAGTVVFRVMKIDTGVEFDVRPAGTWEERHQMWLDLDELVENETKYTIRYCELSKDGIPRFPVGKSIRLDV